MVVVRRGLRQSITGPLPLLYPALRTGFAQFPTMFYKRDFRGSLRGVPRPHGHHPQTPLPAP